MKKEKEGRCGSCVWGKPTGLRYHCMLPSCVKHTLKYAYDLWERQGSRWVRLKGALTEEDEEIMLETYRHLIPGSRLKGHEQIYLVDSCLPVVDLDIGYKKYILKRMGDKHEGIIPS